MSPISQFLLPFFLLFCILFCISGCNRSYPALTFGKGELLYHPQIPVEWAKQTGQFLYDQDFLGDARKTTVLLTQNADTMKLHLVVDPLYFHDTSYDTLFNSLLLELNSQHWSQNHFWVVLLADRNLKPHRKVQ